MHHPLLALVHLIATKITNHVDKSGAELLFAALRQIVGGKAWPGGAVELRRHGAIGLVVNAPQHLLAQRVIDSAVFPFEDRRHQ
ncbi:hypothetical protein D3C81_1636510 [compost metagenome]